MAFKKKIDINNGDQFKFEKQGQQLEGYYIGSFDHEGDYGTTKKHIIQTEDKSLKTVFGQTHLTGLLADIEPGTLVRITLIGSKKMKKGNPMKMYEVEYDEDNRIDAEAAAAEAASASSVEDEESYEEEEVNEEVEQEEEEQPVRQAKPASRPVANVARAATGAPKSGLTPEQKARAQAALGKRT